MDQLRINSKIFKYKGIEDTIKGWGNRKGLSPSIIKGRLKRGWTIEKALETEKQTEDQRFFPNKYFPHIVLDIEL